MLQRRARHHKMRLAFESQRLAVSAGADSTALSDEVVGREVAGGACATVANASWLDRTLVVESEELLRGQKRGIGVALRQAKKELRKLEQRAASARIQWEALEDRVRKVLQREHLSEFFITTVTEVGSELR